MTKELPDFDKLWNYGKPAETEVKFRELLPLAESSGNVRYHAELLTQIARTLGLQMKFDDAHALLDRVEPMLTADMKRVRVRYLLERGRAFNSSEQPKKALPLFVEAWEIGKEAGEDSLAVDAAHMVAIAEEPDKALEWNEKAVEYAEQSSDEKAQRWCGTLHNNIGWTYHDDLKDYEKALHHFAKALEYQEKRGDASLIRIAKWCIARAFRSLGRVEEALAVHEAQLKEYEETGEKPGYTYEELGECLLILNREAESKKYFGLAYAELSQDNWLVRDQLQRLERLKQLST